MPCNSDYLEASSLEVELSRVLLLLRELDTGVPVDAKSGDWKGYMKGAYNSDNMRERTDAAVFELCGRLKKVDVTKFSPEMRAWWRTHQAADAKRSEVEELRERVAQLEERLKEKEGGAS